MKYTGLDFCHWYDKYNVLNVGSIHEQDLGCLIHLSDTIFKCQWNFRWVDGLEIIFL
jgi:hypothetical protein